MFEISESFQDDSISVLEEILKSKKLPVRILATFNNSIGLNCVDLIVSSINAELWGQEIPDCNFLITNWGYGEPLEPWCEIRSNELLQSIVSVAWSRNDRHIHWRSKILGSKLTEERISGP